MSVATNKDFSAGEFRSIIMSESVRVWLFINTYLPQYIKCPANLIVASYFTFTYIGWYGFLVVLHMFAQTMIGYIRGSTESDMHKQKRVKSDKRMSHINESFHNIKGVKLQGWENKFIDKIEAIYQEELELEDKTLYRDKCYELEQGFMMQFMPLLVYGLYVYEGNILNLSSMAMANLMMGHISQRIRQIKNLYGEYYTFEESMNHLNNFYFAPEVQKGLINKSLESSDYVLSIKGSFSWGVTVLDKE